MRGDEKEMEVHEYSGDGEKNWLYGRGDGQAFEICAEVLQRRICPVKSSIWAKKMKLSSFFVDFLNIRS